MKNLKKSMALVAAIAMSASMLAGCNTQGGGDTTTPAPAGGEDTVAATTTAQTTAETQPDVAADLKTGGAVLNCYGWNDEFQGFLDTYYLADNPASGFTVNWVITPTSEYPAKMDSVLTADAAAPADEQVDLMLAEFNYLPRYVDTNFVMPITSLGITTGELANQYPYALNASADSAGVIKASSFQACPELLVYRRSMAQDVLGVSEPADVQPFLKDWAAFDETAQKMSDKGYKMLSSFGDVFYSYANGTGDPIVAMGSNKITVPDSWMAWVDATKIYTDKGFNNKAPGLWQGSWSQDMSGDLVFCYQGPSWLIDFSLLPNVGDTLGDWAATTGPVSTFWGGTWLLAGANTDNSDVVTSIIRYFTTDPVSMENFARKSQTYVNNTVVNNALAADATYQSELLGGQNPYPLYNEVGAGIDSAKVTAQLSKYGMLCEDFQGAFADYFNGTITKEAALENFYTTALTKYPTLER
jgi:hypothetical protein